MNNTLFKEVNYNLGSLMNYIELGEIGLPDIQRPFVWKNAKVRDLFDSMYRGYPVGYLLFWQNALGNGQRSIGADDKQKPAQLLIVDGQQRMTSLYAVMKGVPVIRESYQTEQIEIAFNPLQEKFEVADAAIRRDKSYIPNISRMWNGESNLFEIVGTYLENLKTTREVTPEEEKQVQDAITRLNGLLNFPFTALELSAQLNEEQVAEVFVRINSKGKTLNQSDFILTLMSVFWDEGRTQLETFCREAREPKKGKASPYNHFFQPDPDHLLRVAVGLGFRRARLQHVYSILRGKDLETEQFSEDRREQQFEVLKAAQSKSIELQYWHDFFKVVRQSGHCSGKSISSQTAVLYSYVFYLLGRTVYKVDEYTLRRVIAQWFFMVTLTGRYTSSPESRMESDLARFRHVETGDEFVKILERLCAETLTEDYWNISLPGELSVSSARSPVLFGFYAALVLLDAKVLYSKQKVCDLLDPSIRSTRSGIERHHLHPKAFLKKQGLTEVRDTNQIANYALVEWGDNTQISDQPPADYVPVMEARFTKEELEQYYGWHALPHGWQHLSYAEFLERRREQIAKVIRDGYRMLAPLKAPDEAFSIDELVETGESEEVEFKGALRTNLHTGQEDERIEAGIVRTIAGFMNHDGGKLIVGLLDDGEAIGFERDGFLSEDAMSSFLDQLLKDRFGEELAAAVHSHFEDHDESRVLVVECPKADHPVWVSDEGKQLLFVRDGATTRELMGENAEGYLSVRFPKIE